MTVTFADKNEWLRRNIAICMINRCNTGFGVSRKSGFNQLFGKRRLKLVEPFSGNNLTGKKQICPNPVSSRVLFWSLFLISQKISFLSSRMRQSKIQLTPVAFLPSRLFPSLSLFNSVSWAFIRIYFGGKIPENFEIIKKGE